MLLAGSAHYKCVVVQSSEEAVVVGCAVRDGITRGTSNTLKKWTQEFELWRNVGRQYRQKALKHRRLVIWEERQEDGFCIIDMNSANLLITFH